MHRDWASAGSRHSVGQEPGAPNSKHLAEALHCCNHLGTVVGVAGLVRTLVETVESNQNDQTPGALEPL